MSSTDPLMAGAAALRLAGRWSEATALLATAAAGRPEVLLAVADVAVDEAFWRRPGLESARRAVAAAMECGAIEPAARLLACQVDYLDARFGEADPAALPAAGAGLLARLEDVREAAAALTDERLHGWTRFWSGVVAQVMTGDSPAAEGALLEAEATGDRLGDALLVSYATRHLAWIAAELDRPGEAVERFDRSLELRLEIGFVPGVAAARLALAEELTRQGRDPGEARRLARDARVVLDSLGAGWLAREAAALLESIPAPA
jgi:hypothetical protein